MGTNSFGGDDPQGVDPPASEHDPRFRLDPSRMPQRLDFELPPELLDHLHALALRSGRCLEEIALDLILRSAS
jgi:hypothetical protein